MGLKKQILIQFEKQSSYTEEELRQHLQIRKKKYPQFKKALLSLLADGSLQLNASGHYMIPAGEIVTGRLIGNRMGYGFLVREDGGDDVFIPAPRMGTALHGDMISVRLRRNPQRGNSIEGEVVDVRQRKNDMIVGTFKKDGRGGVVTPDDDHISKEIDILPQHVRGAKNKQKVVVELTGIGRRKADGVVKQVLGYADEKGVGVMSILYEHGIPREFPAPVLEAASAIAQTVSAEQARRREDLRGLKIFTIDGADAKDLDDAVSIQELPGGLMRLGVHIADVSFYVREGSVIDKEALKRGNSVYPVDRVVPMLPVALSNGICSLSSGEDRLTLSCFMDIDGAGKVADYRIAETIINSCYRMTYDDVELIIQGDAAMQEKYADITPDLLNMQELAAGLTKMRQQRGGIDFDLSEAYIELDEDGAPVEIRRRERGLSHRLIEEFMLCANETVARHMMEKKMPFVYRVHEKPDADKLAALNEFLGAMGLEGVDTENARPGQIQKALAASAGKPEEKVVNTVVLRSLKKARYDRENLGHFGLAAKNYCHFTSPIRRYPDLEVHRMLKRDKKGALDERTARRLNARMDSVAGQASDCEVKAMEAERDVEAYMKARYMEKHLGDVFDGVVAGVTAMGIFVELPNTVEGFVPLNALPVGLKFDERNYRLSDAAGHSYALGQKVKILVAAANPTMRRIDFVLAPVEKDEETVLK
ncbi:MAG: ribonuclease R [Christensenellales bacterium]